MMIGVPLPDDSRLGMVQPKMSCKFRVVFSGIDETVCGQLTNQVYGVTRPTYESSPPVFGLFENFQYITINFYDDILNYASNGIELLKGSESFGVVIDMMDGGFGVIESWVMPECWIESIEYSALNYGDSSPSIIQVVVKTADVQRKINMRE